jgi:hypothetical protein
MTWTLTVAGAEAERVELAWLELPAVQDGGGGHATQQTPQHHPQGTLLQYKGS